MKKRLLCLSAFAVSTLLISYANCREKTTEIQNIGDFTITKKEVSPSVDFTINGKTIEGVGRGYDIVNSDYVDVTALKIGSDIFDMTWLRNRFNDGEILPVNKDRSYGSSAYKLADLSVGLAAEYNVKTGATVEYGDFGGGFDAGFGIKNDTKYKTSLSTYFYFRKYTRESYTYSLPSVDDLDTYRSHLSSSYINNIGKFFNGELSATDLFDMYGTHIITQATYGGAYDLYYSAVSNKYNLESETAASYETKINAKGTYEGIKGTATESADFKLTTKIENSNEVIDQKVNVVSHGGKGQLYADSFDKLQNNLPEWLNSIEDNESIININKMIPLWNMLPDEYDTDSNKTKLLRAFERYSLFAKNNWAASTNFNASSLEDGTKGDEGFKYLPVGDDSLEYQISDKGISKQQSFSFDLTKDTVYSPVCLTANKFKYAKITLELQMKEVDDGYQEFYLYKGEDCIDAYKLCSVYDHEYGDKNTKKTDYDLQIIEFPKVLISDLKENNNLTLRFGAHGNGSDTWKMKKIKLKIIYSIC